MSDSNNTAAALFANVEALAGEVALGRRRLFATYDAGTLSLTGVSLADLAAVLGALAAVGSAGPAAAPPPAPAQPADAPTAAPAPAKAGKGAKRGAAVAPPGGWGIEEVTPPAAVRPPAPPPPPAVDDEAPETEEDELGEDGAGLEDDDDVGPPKKLVGTAMLTDEEIDAIRKMGKMGDMARSLSKAGALTIGALVKSLIAVEHAALVSIDAKSIRDKLITSCIRAGAFDAKFAPKDITDTMKPAFPEN